MNFFSWIEFGFCSSSDFIESFARLKIAPLLITFSMVFTYCLNLFGLTNYTMGLLFILFILELVTGLIAAITKKQKIVSRKLHRWGFKILIWIFFILLFQAFSEEKGNDFATKIYSYMHTFIIMYIIGIYSISILENMGVIYKNKREFKDFVNILKKNLGGKNEKPN